jgi:AcrR family transcriptional regulator
VTDSSGGWSRLEPEARRQQIVEAAVRSFGQRPYDAVSMSDVARAAGVTRGLVHHYFPAKPDLYRAVLEGLLAAGPSVVRTDLDLDIEEVVAANADASLDFLEQNRETMLVITQPGSVGQDPRLAEIVDQARETVVDRILLNHLGTTEVPPEVRLVIRGYLGLFEAVAREWLVRGRSTRAEAHALLTRSMIVMMREVLPALDQGGFTGATPGR